MGNERQERICALSSADTSLGTDTMTTGCMKPECDSGLSRSLQSHPNAESKA